MILRGLISLVLLGASLAKADVLFRSPTGFGLQKEVVFEKVDPLTAFKKYVDLKSWWDPAHTWSGDSNNLVISTEKMVFYENIPGQGFVQHGQIVLYKAGELIRFQAALGPLQELGVSGALTIKFQRVNDGTKVTQIYNVSGTIDGDLGKDWADAVDNVMTSQLFRFEKYARGQ